MAVRSIPSPLPAYPAGSSHLSTKRIPSWGRRHRWAALDDPGPNRTIDDGTVAVVGDGVSRGFSWAHGLGVVPASAHVDHPNSLPLPPFDLGWDAAVVRVRFEDPPTRTLTLRWMVVAPDAGTVAVAVALPAEALVTEPLVTEGVSVLLTEDGRPLATEGTI